MKSIIHAYILSLVLSFLSLGQLCAQNLQPGFDAAEYADLLNLEYDFLKPGQTINTPYFSYKFLDESSEVGLFNKCYFWLRSDSVVIVYIRGTIGKTESWLENFYSAMIPATGQLKLNDSTQFRFKLASNENAYVHVGWTLGLAYLSPYILKKLNQLYNENKHEVIIFGHSQGAAIAYLLRSYLQYVDEDLLPHDIKYKTYCSGAPKPGNLYYAYDFDFITRMGWGFRIVNSADWVPETPMSVQTLNDLNSANPIANYKESIKSMSWLVRMYLNSAHNKMSKTSEKGVYYYQKYLGNLAYDQIKKSLPQLDEPEYAPSNAYFSAGTPIVLMPDEEYQHKFRFTGMNIFVHHLAEPYQFLLKKYYLSDYKIKKFSSSVE